MREWGEKNSEHTSLGLKECVRSTQKPISAGPEKRVVKRGPTEKLHEEDSGLTHKRQEKL